MLLEISNASLDQGNQIISAINLNSEDSHDSILNTDLMMKVQMDVKQQIEVYLYDKSVKTQVLNYLKKVGFLE